MKKTQNSKVKTFYFLLSVFTFYFLLFTFSYACAKEITILYTGETHAMLYPCHCPVEPDGGVARRATLVSQLRKTSPQLLLLDSGAFFAGGILDSESQNTELDKQRTLVALKAMEMMKYDAATLGDEEFNFGKAFLEEAAKNNKTVFLSSNLKLNRVAPYIIKESAGIKIGVIGLSNPEIKQKASAIDYLEPKIALKKAQEELKQKGAQLIIVVSHLGENEDLKLINEIGGIDILISGGAMHGSSQMQQEPSSKAGSTIILRPFWQARRLGKAVFSLKDGKVAKHKVEEIRLSDKIKDDAGILSILPRCFRDSECKKEGFVGTCLEPGTKNSQCQFNPPAKVSLTVITARDCKVCNPEMMIKQLKAGFPGLTATYLYYPEAKASLLAKELGISGLPAYLFTKEIEKEKNFDSFKERFEAKGNFYLLKTAYAGLSYFLQRPKSKGTLDLFISLYDKNTPQVLSSIRDFNPKVHFLAVQKQDGSFEAAQGAQETEEYMRSVCIQKNYPEQFWNYISCRAKNIGSSWWEDCLGNLDSQRIKTCARSEEGKNLLKENTQMNKDLQVMFGPAYLVDNQEIFGTQGTPSKEEFKKIFKR